MEEERKPRNFQAGTCYTAHMWFFSRKRKEELSTGRKVIRRVIVGFIIGGAISSIIGKSVLKEKRREHLGEDNAE
jgi:hypothetical protein